MDMDFAISRPLVRPEMPHIRFLFVRSRFCSTLPSDTASRCWPCASLGLHLHQDGQATFIATLPNLPATHRPPFAGLVLRWVRPCTELSTDQVSKVGALPQTPPGPEP